MSSMNANYRGVFNLSTPRYLYSALGGTENPIIMLLNGQCGPCWYH